MQSMAQCDALARIARLPPDLRVALKPFPFAIRRPSSFGDGDGRVELVKALCEGRAVEVCAQLRTTANSAFMTRSATG